MRYNITVKTLLNKILTFSTDKYIVENGFVTWFDEIKKETKRFPVSNCEIDEVTNG